MKNIMILKEQLENITATLETQSNIIKTLTKQVNFLMNNDRNAVMVYRDFSGLSMLCGARAQYVYDNKLCDCKLDKDMHGAAYSVVENMEHYAIIESRSFDSLHYHKLDKKNGIAVDITDEYSKLAEIEKGENKQTPEKKKTQTRKAKDGK